MKTSENFPPKPIFSPEFSIKLNGVMGDPICRNGNFDSYFFIHCRDMNSKTFINNKDEITGLLMPEGSDDEGDLVLDGEDQNFILEDLENNPETVEIIIDSSDFPTELVHPEPEQDMNLDLKSLFKWKKNAYAPHLFTEQENFGFSKVLIEATDDILSIFEQVCNLDRLVKFVIEESIRYTQQKGVQFRIEADEFKAFICINFVMGYHILPTLRDYWSTDSDLGVTFISNVMTFQRYQDIRNALHFTDNARCPDRTHPSYDRAYKVRFLIDHFNNAFQNARAPAKHQSIDEHMIKFKGRNVMKQFIKNKPIRWGFKCWCRCCSKTGYLYECDIYTGRKSHTDVGLGESVVLQLSNSLSGLGCEIFFDNFFNSPTLQLKLLQKNIKACGTVRSNRKYMPKFEEHSKLQRGDSIFYTTNGISVIKWKDNKDVLLCTNYLSPVPQITANRRVAGNSQKISVKCPAIISTYNEYMAGVDLMDQRKAVYEHDRKCATKYYLRFFFDLLDIAVNNSYIVYTELLRDAGKPLTLIEFRRTVARRLVNGFSSRKRQSSTTVFTEKKKIILRASTNTVEHIIIKHEKRGRCHVCPRNLDVKTFDFCEKCQLYLCFQTNRNCFEYYHKTNIKK